MIPHLFTHLRGHFGPTPRLVKLLLDRMPGAWGHHLQ
jgi:hypothetical protein